MQSKDLFTTKAGILRYPAIEIFYSVSAETRTLPKHSPAELSLHPSLRKLEEARLADMHSGADTFKKLFACA